MAKRLWSSLAPTTKARYKRSGITPAMYNNPKRREENKDLFRTAQGKAPQSYTVQRAKQLGIDKEIPKFFSLPRKEQEKLTDMYSGELASRAERRRIIDKAKSFGIDGVSPFDKMTETDQLLSAELWNRVMDTKNPRTGHLFSRDDYEIAKLQFLGFLDENGYDDSIEDWQFFKEIYKNSF